MRSISQALLAVDPGARWERIRIGELSTNPASGRDGPGRHQSVGVRLDFFDADAEAATAQRWRQPSGFRLQRSCILLTSAIVGLKVFSIFGISLDVFRVVGGIIIAYMGVDMLRGSHTVAQTPPADDDVGSERLLPSLCLQRVRGLSRPS